MKGAVMSRSWRVLTVATAVLLATVGVMSFAGASTRSRDTTLVLTARNLQESFLDHHPQGFSQGDEFLFSDQLFMKGRMVGMDGGVCTVIHAAGPIPGPESHAQCVATFDLPKGQITVQGMTPVQTLRRAAVAITGGTGAYRDAGGQGTVTETSEETATIVLHIDNLK
jgi:hypothetical protein